MKLMMPPDVRWSRKILLLVFCIGFFIRCGSADLISGGVLERDMSSVASKLDKDINYAYELRTHRIGKSGFYYILSSDGIIVFHPQAVLIGSNMSSRSFVRDILERKNGCLSYGVEDKRLVIFFRLIRDENILCLSILENDIKDMHEGCTRLSLE